MKHPPYHLRTNKAVERFLLVDLIRAVGLQFPKLSDFTYSGFGGPFLEDFRLIHDYLPEIRTISIEEDSETFKRQKRHKYSSSLKLKPHRLDDYMTHVFSPSKRDIFWLDYTKLKFSKLEEFQTVLSAVDSGSIVKITLPAERPSIPTNVSAHLSADEVERVAQSQRERFLRRFGRALPEGLPNFFDDDLDFAKIIVKMVRWAADNALNPTDSGYRFLPAQVHRYRDGNQMVSITGFVLSSDEMEEQYKKALSASEHVSFSWSSISEINVPDLSLIEQFWLAPKLPRNSNKPKVVANRLGYMIDRNEAVNDIQVQQYGLYHKYYPQFARLRH